MFTFVYSICVAMFTRFYLCLPRFTCVYLCLTTFTRACLPRFTHLCSWLSVFTRVNLCILLLSRASLHMLTIFTLIYCCLPMFIRVKPRFTIV